MLIFLKSSFITVNVHIVIQPVTKIPHWVIWLSLHSSISILRKENKSKSALYSLGIVLFLRGFALALSKNTPLPGVAILHKLSKINLLGWTSRLSSSIFMSWLTSIISSLSFSTSTDLFALAFLIRNCISFGYKVDTILKKNSLSGSSLSP